MDKIFEKKIKHWMKGIFTAMVWMSIGILISPSLFKTGDIISPQEWVDKRSIEMYENKVCILGEYNITRISNTKSMDPLMDNSSVVLYRRINSLEKINVGDIIAYKRGDGKVVHRVTKITEDGLITKGDNNVLTDNGVVTNQTIFGVVIGIIY